MSWFTKLFENVSGVSNSADYITELPNFFPNPSAWDYDAALEEDVKKEGDDSAALVPNASAISYMERIGRLFAGFNPSRLNPSSFDPSAIENLDRRVPTMPKAADKGLEEGRIKAQTAATPASIPTVAQAVLHPPAHIEEISQPLPVVAPVFAPAEAIPVSEKAVIKAKNSLIDFYLDQKARLLDLQEKLAKASPGQKHKIQNAILAIEKANMAKVQHTLSAVDELELIQKYFFGGYQEKTFTQEEIAAYLKKSTSAVRSFFLGQAYAQVILEKTPEFFRSCMTLDSRIFKDAGELQNIFIDLQKLKGNDLDISQIAAHLKMPRQKAVQVLRELFAVAERANPALVQKITTAIDQQVAANLQIPMEEITASLQTVVIEKRLNDQLNHLGQESASSYPVSYREATSSIFDKHGMTHTPHGIWHFFHKGNPPEDQRAENQWKLFLNPKPSEFKATLDRALKVLSTMPYVNGKIIRTDDYRRKSSLPAVEDPCEPKLLFYFNGPTSVQDFKKAIYLLEKEFADADIVGLPAGQRDIGHGKEEKWGPSFTNQRNRMLFYTQGGFTESGRDIAVQRGTLDKLFDGGVKSYHLHKGTPDPLAEEPVLSLQLEQFLTHMRQNITFFTQPLHLVKLQNILNRLKQERNPSPQVLNWQACIRDLMVTIAAQMPLSRQAALEAILAHKGEMADVRNAVAQTQYTQLSKNLKQLDSQQGILESKLTYLCSQVQENISVLEKDLRGTGRDIRSFQEIYASIPASLRPLFIEKAVDLNKIKSLLIVSLIREVETRAKKAGISLPKDCVDKIKSYLDATKVSYENDKFVLKLEGRGYLGTFFSTIKLSSLTDYYVEIFDNHQKEKLKQAFDKADEISLPLITTPRDVLNLGQGLRFTLSKLQGVLSREQKRLATVKRGETVIIPQYFHATSPKAATSIAKSGIEAVRATLGIGAFVSTEPEVRYGFVAFGLPKSTELSSETSARMFYEDNMNLLNNPSHMWAGLKQPISINPRLTSLRNDFMAAVRHGLYAVMQAFPLKAEEKFKLEEKVLQQFDQSVVFRAIKGKDENEEGEGWALSYRINYSSLEGIKNDKDFDAYVDRFIGSAIRRYTSAWESEKKITPEQGQEMVGKAAEQFRHAFKSAYYYGTSGQRDDYVVVGKTAETFKASIICVDDDLQDHYQKEYDSKAKRGKKVEIEVMTLSTIQKMFHEAGITSNSVEFIPWSEQLIERDFLVQADATMPVGWVNKPKIDEDDE